MGRAERPVGTFEIDELEAKQLRNGIEEDSSHPSVSAAIVRNDDLFLSANVRSHLCSLIILIFRFLGITAVEPATPYHPDPASSFSLKPPSNNS